MKVLFVTRKFPPSVGGLETAAYGLYSALSKKHQVKLIKWGGSNTALPIVFPWLLVKAIINGWTFKPDIIYVQDGVLSQLAWIVKKLSRRPVVISVHGLELTYSNWLHQSMLRYCLPKLDKVVAGSGWTKEEALKLFPKLNLAVVSYGLKDDFNLAGSRTELLSGLPKKLRDSLGSRKIILTTGRLVERKGVEWFIQNVLKDIVGQLPSVLYVVVGEGPKKEDIKSAVNKRGLAKNVLLLGQVDAKTRNTLYNLANLFIMPNIPVVNDGEGFGLVALEASSCGTPVIGAKLEGIKDAVKPIQNGFLLPSGKTAEFSSLITKELKAPSLDRKKVRSYVVKNFSWETVADQYANVFDSLL